MAAKKNPDLLLFCLQAAEINLDQSNILSLLGQCDNPLLTIHQNTVMWVRIRMWVRYLGERHILEAHSS